MKCVIVYAHPNPKSFNHAIVQAVAGGLKSKGHEVRIRDLYKAGFDPLVRPADLAMPLAAKASPPKKVKEEQKHIAWADALFFVYPIWWDGMPAMLKGYFDRVLTTGFSHEFGPRGPRGLLKGKKVAVFNTTAASEPEYEKAGVFKSMDHLLEKGIFEFCGMEVSLHKYFCSVLNSSEGQRKAMLAEAKKLAAGLR